MKLSIRQLKDLIRESTREIMTVSSDESDDPMVIADNKLMADFESALNKDPKLKALPLGVINNTLRKILMNRRMAQPNEPEGQSEPSWFREKIRRPRKTT